MVLFLRLIHGANCNWELSPLTNCPTKKRYRLLGCNAAYVEAEPGFLILTVKNCCIGEADSLFTIYVAQHVWHRLLLFCQKRTLVLDAFKILSSEEVWYVGWWNSLVVERLQHWFCRELCTCFLNFGFSSSALVVKSFLHHPAKFLYADIATWTTICSKCFWPSYGLLPNKTGFLLLSCSQVFSM